MNRLRLGLSAVAIAATIAVAGCASSSSPAASGGGSTPVSGGAKCAWGPSGGGDVSKTGTPGTTAPNHGNAIMKIVTNQGTIEIKMDASQTPCTIASFAYLAGKHFFDKTPCHRLTTNGIYVLQCGDPTGTGTGGPAYTIPDEALPANGSNTPKTYPRGSIAMANTGQPNSGGSQFFLVYKDSPLTASYTEFGTITSGLDVLDKIAAGGDTESNGPGDGAPKVPVQILSMTVSGPA